MSAEDLLDIAVSFKKRDGLVNDILSGSGSLLVIQAACPLRQKNAFSSVRLPFLLQGMENALAKEGKTCPTIAHPLNKLEFVHVSFDHPIALRQGPSCR